MAGSIDPTPRLCTACLGRIVAMARELLGVGLDGFTLAEIHGLVRRELVTRELSQDQVLLLEPYRAEKDPA